MAIRVTHGNVGTFARFGIEAGKGEAAARSEAEAAATARTQAAAGAQVAAQAIRADADIKKAVIDAQSRTDAMEFQSFLAAESSKRAMAWEVEKTERRNLHDFDMLEQRRDVENQLVMDEELRERSKLSSKKQALTGAAERGEITQAEAQREILRLEVGAPATYSSVFGKPASGDDALSKEIARMIGQGGVGGEVIREKPVVTQGRAANELTSAKKSKYLTTEDRKEIDQVLATNNPTEIVRAAELVQAKIDAAEQVERTQAEIADTRSPFFRQSMGSFR